MYQKVTIYDDTQNDIKLKKSKDDKLENQQIMLELTYLGLLKYKEAMQKSGHVVEGKE